MIQHFVAPPQWEWYIVWYFFLGGIAGGLYALGAVLRLVGDERDAPIARLAFLLCLPILVICPILLTLDLGRPLRFWHMMIDSRTFSLNFKYWSPMSVGVWVLLIFGVFALVSFLEALANLRTGRAPYLVGGLGRVFVAVGAFFGLFLAGYTGVLLSVSNQPIWSDTWALGALFLASGLSVAAASRNETSANTPKIRSTQTPTDIGDQYLKLRLKVRLSIIMCQKRSGRPRSSVSKIGHRARIGRHRRNASRATGASRSSPISRRIAPSA